METQRDTHPDLQLCRCSSAVVDDETCILCGRYVAAPSDPEPAVVETPSPSWTRAGIVRAIRTFAFFHDRPPSEAEWMAPTGSAWPSAHAVRRHFGSFDDGLAAAGIV